MDEKKLERAKERVGELKGFYSHLISYLAVNAMLIIINLLTSPTKLWFYWVTIFWGIGLLFHAIRTFTIRGKYLGKEWEEKKAKEIMEKEEKK